MLIDGIPEPKFGRDSVVEPLKHGQAITALGGRRQSQQLYRRNAVEERSVRRCRGMMELIDDDDVEVAGVDVLRARSR